MGIEPTAQAWEAWVLPLYDARDRLDSSRDQWGRQISESNQRNSAATDHGTEPRHAGEQQRQCRGQRNRGHTDTGGVASATGRRRGNCAYGQVVVAVCAGDIGIEPCREVAQARAIRRDQGAGVHHNVVVAGGPGGQVEHQGIDEAVAQSSTTDSEPPGSPRTAWRTRCPPKSRSFSCPLAFVHRRACAGTSRVAY
jgi:hypothetical protein